MIATDFTPWSAAIGGAMIGLSAVVLMATAGRIAGATGIFAGLFTGKYDDDFRWRFIFIVGLLAGAAISGWLVFDARDIAFAGGPALSIVGGLFVGAGVILGAGCTSGHGICGLARFSRRSLVATCVFMGIAIVTVIVTRHGLGG